MRNTTLRLLLDAALFLVSPGAWAGREERGEIRGRVAVESCLNMVRASVRRCEDGKDAAASGFANLWNYCGIGA